MLDFPTFTEFNNILLCSLTLKSHPSTFESCLYKIVYWVFKSTKFYHQSRVSNEVLYQQTHTFVGARHQNNICNEGRSFNYFCSNFITFKKYKRLANNVDLTFSKCHLPPTNRLLTQKFKIY